MTNTMEIGVKHKSKNSLKSKSTLKVGKQSYEYFSLPAAYKALGQDLSRLPYSLKILLENLLRYEDGQSVTADDISAFVNWSIMKTSDREIAFRPARVLMQDFTGVPAVVDLAAMRDAMLHNNLWSQLAVKQDFETNCAVSINISPLAVISAMYE